MHVYVFFIQADGGEHKKKNPEDPVDFAKFSKKLSERWKTMSRKEKPKFDEMAKADTAHCDGEMEDYGPAKGGKKEEKRLLSAFSLFCSEFHSKIKSANPVISWRHSQ